MTAEPTMASQCPTEKGKLHDCWGLDAMQESAAKLANLPEYEKSLRQA